MKTLDCSQSLNFKTCSYSIREEIIFFYIFYSAVFINESGVIGDERSWF